MQAQSISNSISSPSALLGALKISNFNHELLLFLGNTLLCSGSTPGSVLRDTTTSK